MKKENNTNTRSFDTLMRWSPQYLKQELDDDLSICMDERSPCSLSITGDIKIYQYHLTKGNDVTTPNGEVPYGLLSRSCFYCLNLITAAPL